MPPRLMPPVRVHGKEWQLKLVSRKLIESGITSRFPRYQTTILICYPIDDSELLEIKKAANADDVGICMVSGIDYVMDDFGDYLIFNELIVDKCAEYCMENNLDPTIVIKTISVGCHGIPLEIMLNAGYIQ